MDYNTDVPPLASLPIILAGDAALTHQLSTLLSSTGAAAAAVPHVQVASVAELQSTVLQQPHGVGLCVLALPHDISEAPGGVHRGTNGQDWASVLAWLQGDTAADLPRCPVLVCTESRALVAHGRGCGCRFFLPVTGLTPSLLADAVHATQHAFGLAMANHHLQAAQHLAEQRFTDVAEQVTDWVYELDANLRLVYSSSRQRPVRGAQVGSPFSACFLPEERLRIEDDFAQISRQPRPFQQLDYWGMDAYGTRMCWAVSGVPVLGAQGQVVGFRGVARDVSSAKSAREQLYTLANTDPLTGVYNRGRVQAEVARFARVAKQENRSGALLVLDVDHFAYINETYGHHVGDQVLVHLSQLLKDQARSGDCLGRLGGDEFVLMLPDVPAGDLLQRVQSLQRILHQQPLELPDKSLSFSVSVGVVKCPYHGSSADELLHNASRALATAKSRGRNRVCVFSPTTGAGTAQQADALDWVDFLHKCLANETQRMVLHYQPIVALQQAGGQEFYEVLVRMLDNTGALVPPTRFIAVAEDFGLVTQIDHLVVQRAVQQLRVWHQQGRQVRLAINVFPKTFAEDAFIDVVTKTIGTAQLPDKSLVMELTETALMADLTGIRKTMERLRKLGIAFALDDCGVGYSSFNYIKHLPLDFIKIDGSFVRNMHMHTEDDAFVKALADIAQHKHIQTIAEMVEHGDALPKLRALGVDYGQGYFFATPAPELPASAA